jgi:membrane-bound lytic murein transglycosylase A
MKINFFMAKSYDILKTMSFNRLLVWCVILALLFLSFSCAQKRKVYVAPKPLPLPPPPVIVPPPELPPLVWTAESAMNQAPAAPDLRDDEPAQTLLEAVDLSLQKFAGMDGDAILHFGCDAVPVRRVFDSLNEFRTKLAELGLSEEFFRYVRENFVFYSSTAPQVVFTGYYEPLLRGSRCRSPQYPYPLYGRPADLLTVDLQQFYFYKQHPDLPMQIKGRADADNRVVPYFNREEIDFKRALSGRGLEIVWIDDLVDIFFLHIQGSGIVEFEDGSRIFVGYADQNGHPFRSVGRFLLDRQLIDRGQLSMQGMKAFLKGHPEAIPDALNSNPSYVFFQVSEQSATGTFGTRLTPWRSIASDQRLFPLGALAWIECEKPLFDPEKRINGWEKFGRFVLNQDTGGAIRGADRADLFTGHGERSELVAGNMKQKGALYFLLKKAEDPSIPVPTTK